ncbi:MAG: hypothetical protein RIT52_1457 [Pseudomonadota bacterium]
MWRVPRMTRGHRFQPPIGAAGAGQPVMLDVIRQHQLHLCMQAKSAPDQHPPTTGNQIGQSQHQRSPPPDRPHRDAIPARLATGRTTHSPLASPARNCRAKRAEKSDRTPRPPGPNWGLADWRHDGDAPNGAPRHDGQKAGSYKPPPPAHTAHGRPGGSVHAPSGSTPARTTAPPPASAPPFANRQGRCPPPRPKPRRAAPPDARRPARPKAHPRQETLPPLAHPPRTGLKSGPGKPPEPSCRKARQRPKPPRPKGQDRTRSKGWPKPGRTAPSEANERQSPAWAKANTSAKAEQPGFCRRAAQEKAALPCPDTFPRPPELTR